MFASRKFYREYIRTDWLQSEENGSSRQSTSSPDLTLLFSLTLLTYVIMTVAIYSLPKQALENHPMCGITTGGQDECYFDCGQISCTKEEYDFLVEDLSCIADCFEKEPDSCVTSLLNDINTKGVCIEGPGIYPLNNECEIDVIDYGEYGEYEESGDYGEYEDYEYYGEDTQSLSFITKGTCSEMTERLLQTDQCLHKLFSQQDFIINTITALIFLSCRFEVSTFYFVFLTDNNLGRRKSVSRKSFRSVNKTRLAPVQIILENNIRTKLEYENTRNRYPWVCSLRSTGPSPEHRCAVNLLSIPPSPTVLVGAAHCTYLCKDGSREVPVCCCSFGTDDCRDTDPRCGESPEVVEMGAADSVIVCGEWDTSQTMSVASGERYNVKLPILEIVRHPDFNPAKGPQTGNDIVTFKVDDTKMQNNVANNIQLWPACLPSQGSELPKTGIHTGWSQPPAFPFIQSQVQGFARFYNDFYKQWHYKMDILDVCKDPKESPLCGAPLQYPSNSSYPPGTVCAKDFTRQSCFSTGDSGSPLMVKYENEQDKFHIEGILSFVKGCDQFEFGEDNEFSFTDKTTYTLTQRTENPTTYTKLSCFLPWVAAQYNMRYELTGPLNQACLTGSGDPEDGKNTCRNTPSTWVDLREEIEFECKFPFYYNDVKYNECILFYEEDFLYPVFRCPIRDITTKINGTNSFNSSSLIGGYCLSDDELNAQDPEQTPLDPENTCKSYNRRPPFSQCKNNCPGVRALGIIGGGAVLAGVGTLGVLGSWTPVIAAGAFGAAGVGSMMVAESMCASPFFCRTLSGQCCPVVINVNGPVCPDTC